MLASGGAASPRAAGLVPPALGGEALQENGFDAYKKLILDKLEGFERRQEKMDGRLGALEISIANLKGKAFVWGTIAGALFGAGVGLLIAVLSRTMGG